MATDNCAHWVLSVVRRDLDFNDNHAVTMPELCWWLVRNDLADALPESAARKALRLPKSVLPSVTRESDLVPSVPATSIIQDKAKKVLALKVDPESPESFMLRPKRRRWVNEQYTRWVKTQPCACCGKPADDPHHLIGHGQGGMGTKAHDLFVLPLCRKHHDELHADTVAFEEKYGSQLELIFRFIDRALAIGVLA
ncbi:putative prophage protein [Escherichia coli]|nr:putative prophage protein [Escherichia coli]CUA64425.1 putative prophage protein [Escherichia coli]